MRWPPNQAWTSTKKREGYRHFEVKQFGGKGKERWVELYPVLEKAMRLRVPIAELKDPNEWTSGWLQLPEGECCDGQTEDMNSVSEESQGSTLDGFSTLLAPTGFIIP